MEAQDLELIEKVQAEDPEIKALWEQHQSYDALINKIEGKVSLDDAEKQEIKELKKKKLAGKTKLQTILDKYRNTEA